MNRRRHHAITIGPTLLAATIVCLWNLGSYRPLTTHETYVAQTAREMRQAGNWIVPRFLGDVRLKKPPLAYWLALASFSLTGIESEWTARLPSALAGIALAGLAAWFTSRCFGPRVGLFAGFAQATMVYVVIQSRLAEVDMTLTLCVAAALTAYGSLLSDRRSATERNPVVAWVFWAGLGAAALAKGPVGPIMILSVVLAHAAWTGDWHRLKSLAAIAPMASAMALAFGWPVALAVLEPSALDVWWNETVLRVATHPRQDVRGMSYYPLAAVWLTLPWTPLWLWGLANLRQRAAPDRPRARLHRLLCCWVLAPMLLLSLSAGKQEHYLMPALMPVSIWTALALDRLFKHLRRVSGMRAAYMSFARAGAAIVLVLIAIEGLLLPRIYSREASVAWAQSVVSKNDEAGPVVLLGHSVLWLAFYIERPLTSALSIEEYEIKAPNGPFDLVSTREILQTWSPPRAAGAAPSFSPESGPKSPALVRIERAEIR